METPLSHYWDAAVRRLPAVLLVSAAAALAAWLFVRALGPTYEVHFSYIISLSEREETGDFRFDGYYALSATDLFATTVAEWLKAPETVVAAYERGGVELSSRDPTHVVRSVSAEKTAPQLVAVAVRAKDREQAERLARGLQDVMGERLAAYHEHGVPALRFRAVATEPWVGARSLSAAVISAAVFIFTFFAVINLTVLRESIRRMS
jgi:hypothetical protein